MRQSDLSAPFPWFGGKRKVADAVWQRFGRVVNYVEPFFGSGAVLLGRPSPFDGNETINDLDGYVANFWRAVKHAPEDVAEFADNPVNENDLHARHVWLLQKRETLQSSLEGDPDFFDAKIAGYWVWGVACWIADGFCSGAGPWWVNEDRQLVHLGDNGRGVNRKLVHLGDNGRGEPQARLSPWFNALAERLRRVRVCSGDWSRVCGPSVTSKHGLTGVFLDPPYADTANRRSNIYRVDSEIVAHAVREWAIENGGNKLLRIALCGYEGEHEMPGNWSVYEWSAGEGYGRSAAQRSGNGKRERIWFSPACPTSRQASLFEK
jgi:site-specific DNA-adenine methylase